MTQGMSVQLQTQTGTVPSMGKNNRSSLWVLLKGRMVYNVHVWLCDGHTHKLMSIVIVIAEIMGT